MPPDENAQKKPAFQVIEGQGGKPQDTRPPVARFGRHTLPEAVIVIRRFVAQYGAPRTFEAKVDEAMPPADARPTPRHSRWPTILLTAILTCVLTAFLGAAYLRFKPSEPIVQVQGAEPGPATGPSVASSVTLPLPVSSTSPASPGTGAASAVAPRVNKHSELVVPSPPRLEAPPKPKSEPAYRSDY